VYKQHWFSVNIHQIRSIIYKTKCYLSSYLAQWFASHNPNPLFQFDIYCSYLWLHELLIYSKNIFTLFEKSIYQILIWTFIFLKIFSNKFSFLSFSEHKYVYLLFLLIPWKICWIWMNISIRKWSEGILQTIILNYFLHLWKRLQILTCIICQQLTWLDLFVYFLL